MSLPIMNYFYFDGRDSREWRIGLSGTGVYNAPARDVTVLDVPGRNGSVVIDNGRYINTSVTYPCWIARDFNELVDDFRDFLSAHQDGYYRLEDSYHPDEFRMARYQGPFESVPGTRNLSGTFDVIFDCQPERWLKVGEEWVEGSVLYNPTRYTARPIIRVTGTGTLMINDDTITVMSMPGSYLDIDTKNFVFYDANGLHPAAVTINAGFKGLLPDVENQITANMSYKIMPRWWTL